MFVTNGFNMCLSVYRKVMAIIITSHIKVISGIIYFAFYLNSRNYLRNWFRIEYEIAKYLAVIYENLRRLGNTLERVYGIFADKR